MPVVLVMAAVAILAGVVVIAVGRGGELAIVRSDVPPVRFDLFTPADVAAFRPRLAFFGYSARVTDDALLQIARAVAERDAELSRLRVQLTAVRDQLDDGAEPGPARAPGTDQEPAAGRGMTDPGSADAWPEAARDEPESAGAWPPASHTGAEPDAWPSPAGHAPEPDAWPSVVGHPPEPDELDLAGTQAPRPESAAGGAGPAVTAGPAASAAAGDEADPVARYWDEDR